MNKDVLFIIAKKLSLSDLVNFSQLNKNTYTRKEIWLYKLNTEYPNWKSFNLDKTLKEIYATLYQIKKLKNKLKLDYTLLDLFNLQRLNLKDNKIRKIPKEIGLLDKLEYLNLSNNEIKIIPKEIKNLVNLKKLDLSHNIINEIPKEIGNLNNLEIFDLSHNIIRKIPKEIGQLQNLQSLGLSNNQIRKIPKEIRKLNKLENINLIENKIKKGLRFINSNTKIYFISRWLFLPK